MMDAHRGQGITIEITSHGNEVNFFEPIAAYCSSSIFCEVNV